MLDHFGFNVQNLEKSVLFYEKCLEPLGLEIIEQQDSDFCKRIERKSAHFFKSRIHAMLRSNSVVGAES
ncbi:MAG: VOC family protein [Bdellovibrio sp.]|nr:VOC family protein [Bdellovibrio sp.]